MTKFKIGDRVRCIASHDDKEVIVGKVGTVRTSYADSCGVEFDEAIDGHGLNGRCEYGHGWNIDISKLELVKPTVSKEKIILFTQGTSVIAKYIADKTTIDTAVARCSLDDVFDVFIGAQLAVARLASKCGSKIVLPKEALKGIEII